ncbi:MAG: hypothetical protein R3Y63_15360 [Eubacteriales bacterium]
MDKNHELDRKFDELTAFIKTCDKSTYPEYWKAVERYVYRASFIVFNFDKPLEQLEAELDRGEKGAEAFEKMMQAQLAKEREANG